MPALAQVRRSRDLFDANYVPKRRERVAKHVEQAKALETMTRVDTLAKQQTLAMLDLEMPMGDGRPGPLANCVG